jgi:hypothetical protein
MTAKERSSSTKEQQDQGRRGQAAAGPRHGDLLNEKFAIMTL